MTDNLTPAPDTATRGADALLEKWAARYQELIDENRTFEAEQVIRCINGLKALAALPVQDTAPCGMDWDCACGARGIYIADRCPACDRRQATAPRGNGEVLTLRDCIGFLVSMAAQKYPDEARHYAERIDALLAPPAAQASDTPAPETIVSRYKDLCRDGERQYVDRERAAGRTPQLQEALDHSIAHALSVLLATPPHDTGTERGEAVDALIDVLEGAARDDQRLRGFAPRSELTERTRARIKALFTRPAMQASEGADSARLDWLDAHEFDLRYFREDIGGDEYAIWCQVTDGEKSISGHPLATAREAIDAARATQEPSR